MKETIRIVDTHTGYDVADQLLEALNRLGIKARYTTHSSDHVDLEISTEASYSVPFTPRRPGGKDASPDEIQRVLAIVKTTMFPKFGPAMCDLNFDFPKMREDIQETFGPSEFIRDGEFTVCVRRIEADPDGLHAEVRIRL